MIDYHSHSDLIQAKIEAEQEKMQRDEESLYSDVAKQLQASIDENDEKALQKALNAIIEEKDDDAWQLLDALTFAALKTDMPESKKVFDLMVKVMSRNILKQRNLAGVH